MKRPYTLTIAGFDPCAGAGVLADIKTFEQIRTYGMAVLTANTFQHESQFVHTEWASLTHIEQQIDILAQKYTFSFIKIGLIESIDILFDLLQYLHTKFYCPKIIWDPIFKASAGFEFHNHISCTLLEKCLSKLYVITPNYLEIQQIGSSYNNVNETLSYLTQYCNVVLKGGHNPECPNTDILATMDSKKFFLKPKQGTFYPKHGSGCVFSAALTAYLARGYSLLKATVRAKHYTAKFLSSSNTLLGLHR